MSENKLFSLLRSTDMFRTAPDMEAEIERLRQANVELLAACEGMNRAIRETYNGVVIPFRLFDAICKTDVAIARAEVKNE